MVGGDVPFNLKFPTTFNGKMAVIIIIYQANTGHITVGLALAM